MINQKSGYYHRLIFKAVVLFTQIASCAAYVHAMIAPYQKFLLAWGALLIVLELVRGYRPWKQPGTVLFSAFLLGYLGTIFAAGKAYQSANLHAFFYMVMMFVLFCAADTGDREQRRREFAVLSNVAVLAILAMTLTGLVLAVTVKKGGGYMTSIGEIGHVGLFRGRFCGVVNANTGGALYASAILLSAGMMLHGGRHRGIKRGCYGLVILVETAALLLSYSRTAIYALAAALAAGIFWQLPNRVRRVGSLKKAARTVVRTGAALLAAAVLVLCAGPLHTALYGGLSGVRKWYRAGTEVQVASADLSAGTAALFAKNTEEEGGLAESLDDTLSGRLTIWKAALRVTGRSPILGISHEAVSDALSKELNSTVWHAHSFYLTVPLASGLLGCVFLTLFTGHGLRLAWKRRTFLWRSADPVTACAGAALVFMLVKELTESTVLFRFSFFACFLWLLLGSLRQELEDETEPAAADKEPESN